MSHKNVIAGILALGIGNLAAGLLDNSDILEEKYGEPVLISQNKNLGNLETRTYEHDGYIIHALVANEKYAYGIYANRAVWQWTKRADGKSLTTEEIVSILDRNPLNTQWKFQGTGKWSLGNYGIASYDFLKKVLVEKIK